METAATYNEMGSNHRRRPLHTCAASIISITAMAYHKTENLNAPPCSLMNKIANAASLASPLIQTSQCMLLTMLSFVDDWIILPFESTMEAIFPPWKYLFDKVDGIVQVVERLPGKVENAVEKFPEIVHQVPVLNMVLHHAIFWLKFFLSVLNDCGNMVVKEKEIVVDENCNEGSDEATDTVHIVDQGTDQMRDFCHVGSGQGEIKGDLTAVSASGKELSSALDSEETKSEAGSPKPSYKDALEKGRRESSSKNIADGKEMEGDQKLDVSKEESVQENGAQVLENNSGKSQEIADVLAGRECTTKEERSEMKGGEQSGNGDVAIWRRDGGCASNEAVSLSKDDAILALFESAWLMMPPNRVKEDSIPRSASYQW